MTTPRTTAERRACVQREVHALCAFLRRLLEPEPAPRGRKAYDVLTGLCAVAWRRGLPVWTLLAVDMTLAPPALEWYNGPLGTLKRCLRALKMKIPPRPDGPPLPQHITALLVSDLLYAPSDRAHATKYLERAGERGGLPSYEVAVESTAIMGLLKMRTGEKRQRQEKPAAVKRARLEE